MEHLESLPPPAQSSSSSTQQQQQQHNTLYHPQHLPTPPPQHHVHAYQHHPHYHNHFHHSSSNTPTEAMDTTSDSHPTTANCSFDSERSGGGGGVDTVDGIVGHRSGLGTVEQGAEGGGYRQQQHQGGMAASGYRHRSKSGSGLPAAPSSNHHHRTGNQTGVQRSQSNTVHRLVRTASGRSYMETTFVSEPNHNNQENIPPLRPATELQPLRPTNGIHSSHRPPAATSVDSQQHRTSTADLAPLRTTRTSADLPPLRSSAGTKSDPHSSHNTSIASVSSMAEEPLLSLAEAARMKKEQRKEWYETSLDSPASGRRTKKSISMMEMNDACHTNGNVSSSQSNLNISGSSVGSTNSSTGSVFQSRSDSTDTSQTSVAYESPRNHMIISAGTYQPSREVTKPFEMSDFYKYSTKYRRQSSSNMGGGLTGSTSGSVSSVSSGGDTPLSPVLPPRTAQVLVSNSKVLPPSPNMVAQHSAPAPQQKGVYQPLTPLTCQPIEVMKGSPAPGEAQDPVGGSWDTAPLHQAVPATVTHKRSATLV